MPQEVLVGLLDSVPRVKEGGFYLTIECHNLVEDLIKITTIQENSTKSKPILGEIS